MDIFRENFITNDYIVEVLVERKLKKTILQTSMK